jgi:hypothetical protein
MNYTIGMGSVAVIYVPSFIKIGPSIQKIIGRGFTDKQTHRPNGVLISLLLFFQNKEIRPKRGSVFNCEQILQICLNSEIL